MSPHLKYLLYVLKHKLYVYQAGRDLGLGRLRLLAHDWQKFLPIEWSPYVQTFYGFNEGPRRSDGGYDPNAQGAAFDRAWNHHQKLGPHHWQYWLLPLDDGGTKVLEMPEKYRREMLADWRGAGLALGKPDTRSWYLANRDNMVLAPRTRAWVEGQLL